MKNIFLIFLFFNLSNPFFGQEDTIKSKNTIPKFQLYVQLRTAMDRTNFIKTQGTEEFKNRMNGINSFRIGFDYKLKNNFSLTGRLAHSNVNLLNADNLNNHTLYPLSTLNFNFSTITNRSFGVEWGLSFKNKLKNDFWLKYTLGMGKNYYFFIPTGLYASRNGSLNSNNYSVIHRNQDEDPFKFFLEVGFSKYFINSKNLNLSFVYERFMSVRNSGNYLINKNGNNSEGSFSSSGNNFGLSLTYMFGAKQKQSQDLKGKQKRSSFVMTKDSLGIKHWESKNSIDKRNRKKWHEKSILFHLNHGFFFTRNKFTGYENHFNSHFAMSLSTSLSVEMGLKKNLYFESGLSLDKYTVSEKLAKESILSNHYFSASKLNVGLGYRVFSKRNNKHLFNFQAGASLSFLNSSNSPSVSGYNNGGYYSPEFYYLGYHEYSIFPSVYLGIGRDFELSKKMFFSMNLKFNQGFIDTYKKEFKLVYNNPNNIKEPPTYFYTINGTSINLSFGLKYKFLPKKYKEKI